MLLVLGEGPDAMRFILEKFADRLGPMVRLLRELRLKQRLTDGLVKVPDDPAELVEFAWTPTTAPLGPGPDGPAAATTGVGQLVVQPWGFVVCPLDERATWIHFRRASIATVKIAGPGDVAIDGDPGTLILRGLGAAATRLHDTLSKLRDGAFADAAGFVDQLMTDAPFGVRQKASDLLVDGRPIRPDAFGDSGWPVVETAVLGEPTFAESYQSLCATAGPSAPRWVAMAPVDPGGNEPKIWFLIAMPGNLVALELVTAGAHATYSTGSCRGLSTRVSRRRSSALPARRPYGTSARRSSTAVSCASRWRCRRISCACRNTFATGSPWPCCPA